MRLGVAAAAVVFVGLAAVTRAEGSAAVRAEGVAVVVEKDIGGKKLVILEQAVPKSELRRVTEQYTRSDAPDGQSGWGRSFASPQSTTPNAYSLAFTRSECLQEPMFSILRGAAQQFFPQCRGEAAHVTAYGCAINAQNFADVDMAHVDYPPVPPGKEHAADYWGFTAIWYPHETWDVHWGGATAFMDPDESDIMAYALPMPLRLVLFDSSIRHMATPPTIIAAPFPGKQRRHERLLGNRFSFAYKFVCSNLTVEEVFDKVDANEDGHCTTDELVEAAGATPGGDNEFMPLRLVAGLGNADREVRLPQFKRLLKSLKY